MFNMLALAIGGVSAVIAGSSLIDFLSHREKTGVRLRVGSHTLEFTEDMTSEDFEKILSKTLVHGRETAACR